MTETWRDIPGFEDHYQGSTWGRIKRLGRIVERKKSGPLALKEKILTPTETKSGYYQVQLTKNGEKKHYSVAYLIAIAFPEICGEWFPGAETDHINTVRTDNRAENIRFVDRKTNQNNPLTIINKYNTCWKPGRHHTQETKERLKEMKGKKVRQLTQSGEVVAEYQSIKEASEQTGVNRSNINGCCQNRPHYHTAGGFIWQFIS